jgi:hypothetical protein
MLYIITQHTEILTMKGLTPEFIKVIAILHLSSESSQDCDLIFKQLRVQFIHIDNISYIE